MTEVLYSKSPNKLKEPTLVDKAKKVFEHRIRN